MRDQEERVGLIPIRCSVPAFSNRPRSCSGSNFYIVKNQDVDRSTTVRVTREGSNHGHRKDGKDGMGGDGMGWGRNKGRESALERGDSSELAGAVISVLSY